MPGAFVHWIAACPCHGTDASWYAAEPSQGQPVDYRITCHIRDGTQ